MKLNKKKNIHIATLTFHLAHNFGAMLQSYALENKINELGYPCVVIDYRFPYIDQWSGILSCSDIIRRDNFTLGIAKYVKMCLCGRKKKQTVMQAKFNSFMRKNLRLSKEIYFNKEDLKKSEFDVVVMGSDQIWNTNLTNGFASEYVGEYFDNNKTKLISYAASSGTDSFNIEYKDDFLKLLKRFSAIGIREEGLTSYIQSEFKLRAKTVLDPVFLLEKSKWEKLAKKSKININQRYLLLYAFETKNDYIYQLARKISKMRNLKLVSISYEKKEELKDFVQLTDCGPIDFVSLFLNADFVCTTSFHGTAFSILFEKNFYCMAHPLYGQRNIDLLKSLGLIDRLFYDIDRINKITDCNYYDAQKKLEQLRNDSTVFLINAIEA